MNRSSHLLLSALFLTSVFVGGETLAAEIRLLAGTTISSESAAGASYPAAISADGRLVVIASSATNLMAGIEDNNGAPDLFLLDRQSGAKTLITHAAGDPLRTADQGSRAVAVTPDGEFVLFFSWARNLIAGPPRTGPGTDVYLWRRSTQTTTLVSHAAGDPNSALGDSWGVAISASGGQVLLERFVSGRWRGFLYDVAAATLSELPLGEWARARDLSADGRFVLFDGGGDVRILDRQTGQVRSLGSGTAVAIGPAGDPVLFDSDPETYLSFQSEMTPRCISCKSGVYNGGRSLSANGRWAIYGYTPDIRVYDASTGQTEAFLVGDTLETWTGVFFVGITEDGQQHFFDSAASDLDPGVEDHNGNRDAFVLDSGATEGVLLSRAASPSPSAGTLVLSSAPTGWSADGREALFAGPATLSSADRTGLGIAAWAYDKADGSRRLLSPLPGQSGVPATGSLSPLALATDGRTLLLGNSPDPVPGATLQDRDQLFLYSPLLGTYRMISRQAIDPQAGTLGWISEARSDRQLGKVFFLSNVGDLVAGAATTTVDLYSCELVGEGCSLLSRDHQNANEGADGGLTDLRTDDALDVAFFASKASNLVVDGTTGSQVNTFSWTAGEGIRLRSLSTSHPGQEAGGDSYPKGVSTDGRFVIVSSLAPDLDPNALDTNGTFDAYLLDAETGSWQLISTSAFSPTLAASESSHAVGISSDGRYLLFRSAATDVVLGQVDAPWSIGIEEPWDLFLYDRVQGHKYLVSHLPGQPLQAAGYSFLGLPGPNGQVVFVTTSPGLAIERTAGVFDWSLFSWDLESGGDVLPVAVPQGGPYFAQWTWVPDRVSFDGRSILFQSFNDNLTAGDTNGTLDAFLAIFDTLFRDGFEAGNTAAWSLTVP